MVRMPSPDHRALARAEDGTSYSARLGLVPVLFSNIRVPFSAFRPASYFAFDGDAPDLPAALDPSRVRGVSLRHEPARRTLPAVLMPGEQASAGSGADGSKFRLEINRIKVARPPGLSVGWRHENNRGSHPSQWSSGMCAGASTATRGGSIGSALLPFYTCP